MAQRIGGTTKYIPTAKNTIVNTMKITMSIRISDSPPILAQSPEIYPCSWAFCEQVANQTDHITSPSVAMTRVPPSPKATEHHSERGSGAKLVLRLAVNCDGLLAKTFTDQSDVQNQQDQWCRDEAGDPP